ncbi:MAG: tyrosine-type recombinase/integrase [Kaistella sp.]|nr:tyrosine-type recombinase/integrase [Kaistella sp.]
MLERYIDYISVEKRYSPHTVTSYRKDLDDFSHFLLETEGHQNFSLVDRKIIKNFMYHLSEKGISKRSINRKLSTLRSFFLFLLRIREISVSPTEGVETLKFFAQKQLPFSTEEMKDFENIPDDQKPEELKELIIETLYQTGMRKAELIQLRIDDVDYTKNEIKVTGKRNKERIIPFSESLAERFRKYAESRKPLKENGMYFFINKKGKKLTEKFVYLAVNNYLSLVSSKEKISPHILRHSFATHVLENGAEISKIKKLMGHSSLASTQVYTDANIDQLKKVFNEAHPRAKKNVDL